jgi:large subunit ribosomal protein L35
VIARHSRVFAEISIASRWRVGILSGSHMPKAIARSKTKKAASKRFKVTATGKVLRSRAGRRHLLQCKSAKRKRQLAKMAVVHESDMARVKACLPFS